MVADEADSSGADEVTEEPSETVDRLAAIDIAEAQAHDYRPLFWLAALLTVPLTVAAAVGRARYR
jgi:hypothetical protein